MNARHQSDAPRLVTTRFDRGYLYIPGILAIAVAWLLATSTSTPMVVLVLALEFAIWSGWWWRWGRFWHPISEGRWEWREYRLGRAYWNDEQVSYREAWRRAGGDPPGDAHAPAAPAAPRARRG
jgi:hypothetical protein